MEDKDFAEAMRRMVKEHGKEVLLGDKAKSYIGDYRGRFVTESKVFIKLLEADCAKYINEADNVPERKRQLVKRMEDEQYISGKFSMPMLDLLGLLLKGDTSKTAESAEAPKTEKEAEDKKPQAVTAPVPQTDDIQVKPEAEIKAIQAKLAEQDAKYKSRFDEADELCKRDKCKKAFPIIEALAKEGYYRAQYHLHMCYSTGNKVCKCTSLDFAKAHEWHLKAAEQGYTTAMFWLGNYYKNGNYGLDLNYAKAAEWYRKAAELGAKGMKELLDELKAEGKI